jgi:hypothetical protein
MQPEVLGKLKKKIINFIGSQTRDHYATACPYSHYIIAATQTAGFLVFPTS